MIQALTGFPENVLAFAGKGRITKSDYETVLVPAVEEAFRKPGKLRFYYQLDADFMGFDPGAVWDDFKVGMEHLGRWERLAVVTDVEWIRHTVSFFGFLIPGTVKVFHLNEAAGAKAWIVEGITR